MPLIMLCVISSSMSAAASSVISWSSLMPLTAAVTAAAIAPRATTEPVLMLTIPFSAFFAPSGMLTPSFPAS